MLSFRKCHSLITSLISESLQNWPVNPPCVCWMFSLCLQVRSWLCSWRAPSPPVSCWVSWRESTVRGEETIPPVSCLPAATAVCCVLPDTRLLCCSACPVTAASQAPLGLGFIKASPATKWGAAPSTLFPSSCPHLSEQPLHWTLPQLPARIMLHTSLWKSNLFSKEKEKPLNFRGKKD